MRNLCNMGFHSFFFGSQHITGFRVEEGSQIFFGFRIKIGSQYFTGFHNKNGLKEFVGFHKCISSHFDSGFR